MQGCFVDEQAYFPSPPCWFKDWYSVAAICAPTPIVVSAPGAIWIGAVRRDVIFKLWPIKGVLLCPAIRRVSSALSDSARDITVYVGISMREPF